MKQTLGTSGGIAFEMTNQMKAYIFELQKEKVQRCLEPEEKCRNVAIRSHSVQNRRVLDLLQDNGHVAMFLPQLSWDGPPIPELQLVGRKKATTFTGLCKRHDTKIFEPIENQQIDFSDCHHLFLLAYRSVLREYHTTLEAFFRAQLGFQKKADLGEIPRDVPTVEGLVAVDFGHKAYETYLYKREFDLMYLREDWGRLDFFHRSSPVLTPTVAVSSLFSLPDNETQRPTGPPVSFSVIPQQASQEIVFAWMRADREYAELLVKRVSDNLGPEFLNEVSVLILSRTENFVVAPKHLESLTTEEMNMVASYFRETVYQDVAPPSGLPSLFAPKLNEDES